MTLVQCTVKAKKLQTVSTLLRFKVSWQTRLVSDVFSRMPAFTSNTSTVYRRSLGKVVSYYYLWLVAMKRA